ncbi:DUF3052 domain-containing protein [uncultured Corynebacterium sp.]|uniref:DUF3052 domain-containing protein n=1 Tax=uncultured Corynebacterium sp. TaxID=159447 RepID=UPI0028037738|nr:DUF3052 domain-containing protein [uncultured Corynebacterium sp.]
MTSTTSSEGTQRVSGFAAKLGVEEGQVALELGWDEDCDSTISESIEDVLGEDFLEEETDELCDLVLLWWRAEDGDLVDGLVDATRPLGDSGRIWLLTPGAGKPGNLEPGEISESAQLAGLVQTKAERLGEWQGSCLVARGYTKKP